MSVKIFETKLKEAKKFIDSFDRFLVNFRKFVM